jgi:heme exporter protein A
LSGRSAITEVVATGLTKLYGPSRALAGVSARFVAGRVSCVMGGNGAGKSTLLGILSTLVRASAGSVAYGEASGPALRAAIGVLAHEPMVYGELSAEENLRFFGQLHDLPGLETLIGARLDAVGLSAEARQRPARTYSRGMMQRLALARALLHDPGLLLLDEPFTGLDGQGARALVETIAAARAAARIVIVVTHDVTPLAGLCDHVLALRRGKVCLDETRPVPWPAADLAAAYLAHGAA